MSAFSGLLGALLAGLAFAYAAYQSNQTKIEAIRERRIEFELNLLAKTRRQMSLTQFQHLQGYVGALVTDPRDEGDMPLLRAVIGVKSGPLGKRKREELSAAAKKRGDDVRSVLERAAEVEVDEAIQRRLETDGE